VYDRPSNISPSSSGANGLKTSTNGVFMPVVSLQNLTLGTRRMEICKECCRSNTLGIGPRFIRKIRHDRLGGIGRALRGALACAARILAKRTSLLDNPSFHRPISQIEIRSPRITYVWGSNRDSVASQQQYNTFLERANRQFARGNQNAPDPFVEQGRTSLRRVPV